MAEDVQRRRSLVRIVAPAAGLLAAGLLVWQGSYAAFSATTQDTSNTWSSATLSLKNDGGVAGAYAATHDRDLRWRQPQARCDRHHLFDRQERRHVGGQHGDVPRALGQTRRRRLASQIQLTVVAAPTASEVVANCTGFPVAGVTTVATNVPLAERQYASRSPTPAARQSQSRRAPC